MGTGAADKLKPLLVKQEAKRHMKMIYEQTAPPAYSNVTQRYRQEERAKS